MSEKSDWWLDVYKALLDEVHNFSLLINNFKWLVPNFRCKGVERLECGDKCCVYPESKSIGDYRIWLMAERIEDVYRNIDLVIRAHESFLDAVKKSVKYDEDSFQNIKNRLAPYKIAEHLKK